MRYKLITYVPVVNADTMRQAIGAAGGGVLGNYMFCSFSSKGTGRFTPGPGANPTLGIVGKPEQVEEERIEVTVDAAALDDVVAAIKKAHPYEEVPIDIYELK